jgi:citronellol/citronellal dehydrogenase
MTTLEGKTLFITGGSRGIGLAIALRAARDGANVVIAAKTKDPHPHLPGTVQSACEEIERAGGKALGCITDIRSEEDVARAVHAAVERFGGIDVLVNNASAIQLTGTLATPMKRFDLMHQVNARGTFLCTQACIPHLSKAENPHVLTLAPPLNLAPRWFGPHLAYSMAKYGMSLCVLGHAAELQSAGIAVNALWPRTAIATAALRMLPGGDALSQRSRSPEIMADAAHVILTGSARARTGEFCIDEDVLRSAGVSDFSKYASVPDAELLPDLFV